MALLARDRGKLRGLPPTYIGVGSLDLFVEEDVEYARRLMRSGVSVECHVYAGAVHGSDCLPGALGAQFAEAFRGATARLLQK
jgi:acetyl esterase/lipase